jgi:hypothetical protein
MVEQTFEAVRPKRFRKKAIGRRLRHFFRVLTRVILARRAKSATLRDAAI